MTLNTAALWRYDRRLARERANPAEPASMLLCGVDEVGRGPLAGVVVAACVVLDPRARVISGVHDSKKLSEKKRQELAPRIRESVFAFALGEASVEEVDTLNIYHSSYLAMRRAVDAVLADLRTRASHYSLENTPVRIPALVLVDGNRTIPGVNLPQKAVVGGDALSACIAAASILAKVARDAAMVEAAELYPHYGFARHKGYGTLEHRTALLKHGPCPLHRRTFCSNLTNPVEPFLA